MHGAAKLEDGAGNRGRRTRRIGCAVARREDAALPRSACGAASLVGFCAVEHMGGHAGGSGEVAPARPAGQFRLVIAEIEQAAAAEAGVLAAIRCEPVPKVEAIGRHWEFAGVAVLLATPAPVPRGLLGANASLFDKRDLHTAPRQIIGCEDADDTTADDDCIRGLRQFAGCLDLLQWRAHDPLCLEAPVYRVAQAAAAAVEAQAEFCSAHPIEIASPCALKRYPLGWTGQRAMVVSTATSIAAFCAVALFLGDGR
jgi:hypothetical protein